MSMSFDEPAPTTGVLMPPKEIVGDLLLVWAVDYIAHSPTKYTRPDKPSDVVIVDVVNLSMTDEETGEAGVLGRRVWWRNAKLIQALRPRIDSPRPMLAWMTTGKATMGNPPFELRSATQDPQAVARATAWMQAHPEFVKSEKWQQIEQDNAPLDPWEQQPALPKPQEELVERQKSTLQRMADQAQRGQERGYPPPAPREYPY